jgi:hypothetical protein
MSLYLQIQISLTFYTLLWVEAVEYLTIYPKKCKKLLEDRWFQTKIAVIGLGYVGLPLARLFAQNIP